MNSELILSLVIAFFLTLILCLIIIFTATVPHVVNDLNNNMRDFQQNEIVNETFGNSDRYFLFNEKKLEVKAPGILQNDKFPKEALLLVVSFPKYGKITLQNDGSFVYNLKELQNTEDRFVYIAQWREKNKIIQSDPIEVVIQLGSFVSPPEEKINPPAIMPNDFPQEIPQNIVTPSKVTIENESFITDVEPVDPMLTIN